MRWLLLFCSLCGSLFGAQKQILVGAPVRQKPAILKEFLDSLDRLGQENYELSFYFIDDNVQQESSALLQTFAKQHEGHCTIAHAKNIEQSPEFVCDEGGHRWTDTIIWKVASFKDQIIKTCKEGNFDALFFIDSDLVLHPKTVSQLIAADKEIVSNVFWTRWQPDTMEMPQVWLSDEYNQFECKAGEVLDPTERKRRFDAFIEKMRRKGTYEVGGLGACTLIKRSALEKGVSFKRIKNIGFWGEDRHFCIRAAALGIKMHVDTHYPAYHIYRESYLAGVPAFVKECAPKITLSMIVHNEADRYLPEVLRKAREYISSAVIIDDASDDRTAEVCLEELKGIPLTLIRNVRSKFSNEVNLRKQQWEETIKTNPDWILVLDADEIFEDRFKDKVETMLYASDVDVYAFPLYDFWDETHYRDDQYWRGHRCSSFAMLVKYSDRITNTWPDRRQHCGRFPSSIRDLRIKPSPLRVKHFGWSKEGDRIAKYKRYKKLDPDAEFGWREQYESILDPNPNLVAWEE